MSSAVTAVQQCYHKMTQRVMSDNSSTMLDSQHDAKKRPHRNTVDVPAGVYEVHRGQDVKTQYHTPPAAVRQDSPPAMTMLRKASSSMPANPSVDVPAGVYEAHRGQDVWTQHHTPSAAVRQKKSSMPANSSTMCGVPVANQAHCGQDFTTQHCTPSAAVQQIRQPACSLTCSVRQVEVVREEGVRDFFRLVLPQCIPAECLSDAFVEQYVKAVVNSPSVTNFQVQMPNVGTEPSIVGMMSSELGINNSWHIKFAYLQGINRSINRNIALLCQSLQETEVQKELELPDW